MRFLVSEPSLFLLRESFVWAIRDDVRQAESSKLTCNIAILRMAVPPRLDYLTNYPYAERKVWFLRIFLFSV